MFKLFKTNKGSGSKTPKDFTAHKEYEEVWFRDCKGICDVVKVLFNNNTGKYIIIARDNITKTDWYVCHRSGQISNIVYSNNKYRLNILGKDIEHHHLDLFLNYFYIETKEDVTCIKNFIEAKLRKVAPDYNWQTVNL